MAKYCIYFSSPRYDNRDAITGTNIDRGQCFTKLRAAKKAYARESKRAHDELHVTLCNGPRYCGSYYRGSSKNAPIPHRKRSAKGMFHPTAANARQKPTTAKQRRAARRKHKSPDYIPF